MFSYAASSTAAPWSRRLLLQPSIIQGPSAPPYSQPIITTTQQKPATEVVVTPPPSNGFDANVVMVLSVLLCALICSLGLNSIIRCALRCSSLAATDPNNNNTNNNNNNNNNAGGCSRLANTGIKKKALKSCTTVSYSADLNLPGLDNLCAICLYEFGPGDKVRLLPKCNHGFHVRCIDQWLNSHSSCPTCRNCLIETCHKIVGCSQASSSQPSPHAAFTNTNTITISPEREETPVQQPPQEAAIISINPLEREETPSPTATTCAGTTW